MKESKPIDDIKSQISTWKPNTTYLMCNDIQQVVPPENVPRDASAPLLIAFLLPSDSFNGTSSQSTGQENNGMLEVTCQVIDVNILPQLSNSQSSGQSAAVKSSA